MPFEVITPPPPLFSAEDFGTLKSHLEINADDQEWDALVLGYAKAAQSKAESYIRQLLLTQTVRVYANSFRELSLSPGPVRSVDAVEYLATDGEWVAVSVECYRLVTTSCPACVWPVGGAVWPTTDGSPASVRATFSAGLGANRSEIDETIIQAIQILTAHFLENRGDEQKASRHGLHPGAEFLLSDHRVWF